VCSSVFVFFFFFFSLQTRTEKGQTRSMRRRATFPLQEGTLLTDHIGFTSVISLDRHNPRRFAKVGGMKLDDVVDYRRQRFKSASNKLGLL